LARANNHSEAADLLKKAKAAKPAKKTNWKPIMDAAYRGQGDRVRALIAADADPNIISGTGQRWRPLHRAIEMKKTFPRTEAHDAAVKILLELGADPRLRGGWEQLTSLQLSAIGETRFIPILLEHFLPLDIYHACVLGDEKRAAELLTKDPALAGARDENNWTALHYCAASALRDRHPALARIARRLLDAGADVNAARNFGEWPLRALYDACGRSNNAAVAKVLFQAGADACDNESVYHASDEMHAECLELIEKFTPARKLARECTLCLSTQLSWNRSRGMQWLLSHGADPNALHPHRGESALHEAVKRGASDEVLLALLEQGGDPQKKNRDGKSAVALAKKPRVLKTLQRKK
jgi:ankyrin repeat protein